MIPVDAAFAASAPVPAPAPASARALIERQVAVLSRLTDIGMEIAEACGRDARAPAAEAASDDGAAPSSQRGQEIGLVFAKVARAVRMTIALQSRLMTDLAGIDAAASEAEASRRTMRRLELGSLAGRAARASVDAQRQSGTRFWSDEQAIETEIERLSDETYERLTDAEENLGDRSFDEVVAAICGDLRLSPE